MQRACLARGKFCEFGELPVIRQTKTIQILIRILMTKSVHSPSYFLPSTFNLAICQKLVPPNIPAMYGI